MSDPAPTTETIPAAPDDAQSSGQGAPALVTTIEQPASDDAAEVDELPMKPLTSAERMKAKVRAVLDAQPFRGNTVHKADLLAVIDALINGPDDE